MIGSFIGGYIVCALAIGAIATHRTYAGVRRGYHGKRGAFDRFDCFMVGLFFFVTGVAWPLTLAVFIVSRMFIAFGRVLCRLLHVEYE